MKCERSLLASVIACSLCTGCGPSVEYPLTWSVDGTVADQGTGTPVPDARIVVQLFLDGESIGRSTATSTDEQGVFRAVIWYGHAGTGVILIFPIAPFSPALSGPPDEIELSVDTADRQGSVRVAVPTESVSITLEVGGVPIQGVITLPPVEVALVAR